jgi:hypothetical protein
LHEIEPEDYFLNKIRIPKCSDKELIALNLAAECLGIDSERYLFKKIPAELSAKVERSVCNRRRRNLKSKLEQICKRVDRRQRLFESSIPTRFCAFQSCYAKSKKTN